MDEGLRFRSGRKGYKQEDRGLPTVADGELMLEGWSIVSSKEGRGERGKEQVSALQPLLLLPLLLGAKFRKEEGREGLCACGGIFATWAPRFPKLPPPPLLLRHLILFPATQQSRARKLWDRETISHRNEFLPRARIQPHPQKVRRVVQYFSNFIQSSVFESSF